jgi:5-methylcytosine-specific restriction endonuclease McrA
LKRDQYRCCACNRKGDEITLHIEAIESVPADVRAFVTLCAACHQIAENQGIPARRSFVPIAG